MAEAEFGPATTQLGGIQAGFQGGGLDLER
jgi:hypothetical protein